jgi:hypothetical protein
MDAIAKKDSNRGVAGQSRAPTIGHDAHQSRTQASCKGMFHTNRGVDCSNDKTAQTGTHWASGDPRARLSQSERNRSLTDNSLSTGKVLCKYALEKFAIFCDMLCFVECHIDRLCW